MNSRTSPSKKSNLTYDSKDFSLRSAFRCFVQIFFVLLWKFLKMDIDRNVNSSSIVGSYSDSNSNECAPLKSVNTVSGNVREF